MSTPNGSMKLGKKKRFLNEHPFCCLCGGAEPSSELDHIPAKAAFPDGYWPEGFEFPACNDCNRGTKKDDQLFGFFAQLLDFNESNRTIADQAKIFKLRDGILRNYPDEMPDFSTAQPMYHGGLIQTLTPAAMEVNKPRGFQRVMDTAQRKLLHALYYREVGKVLSKSHRFIGATYQLQGRQQNFTEYFANVLPDQFIGGRENIRNYGERFAYKFGYKDEDELFLYAAQFGRGLILWGMSVGPVSQLDFSSTPLMANLARAAGQSASAPS